MIIVYINGVRATKKAIKQLTERLKNDKRLTIELTTTKNGNLNILTNF